MSFYRKITLPSLFLNKWELNQHVYSFYSNINKIQEIELTNKYATAYRR